MVDVGTSKNPRGTYTKKDKEDMMPKTAFFPKLKQVGDTKIGTANMIQLRDRLKEGKSPEGKKGATKSSKLTQSNFKSKYGDLFVLLNRIMGIA